MCARLRPRTDHERDVVRVLESEQKLLTVAEVRNRLTAAGRPTRLATVYQCVNRLVDAGILERLTVRTGTSVYGIRPVRGSGHRLMCSDCALVVDADDDEVTEWVARTAALHGFTVADSSVLLSGTCAACTRPEPVQADVVEMSALDGYGIGRNASDLATRASGERTG